MSRVFDERRVVVCVGTGGVGKTTASAAIAVAAAASGRRTLVMTIDPARRLANALGLVDFGNVEREIPAAAFTPYGVTLQAPLWAMMPDVKRTFDELIDRYAPNDAQKRSIVENKIYNQFATRLAGSLEYAAVEKLYQEYTSGKYDLIVLDTPPSQSAVDFLSAPGRIVTFLEQDTVQWLLKPYVLAGRLSMRLLDFGSALISRSLRRLAGAETLRAIAEFVVSFRGMYDGFRERSQKVRTLLRSEDVAFVLVGTARAADRAAMLRFRAGLEAGDMHARAIVLNRTRPPPYPDEAEAAVQARLADHVGHPHHAAALVTALSEEAMLAREDAAARAMLAEEVGDTPILSLPELPLDVHDLESLSQLHRYFLG